MVQQEKIAEKWKSEHKKTCDYFEKQMSHFQVENRTLKDKVIQLKSTVNVLRDQQGKAPKTREEGSKTREKSAKR